MFKRNMHKLIQEEFAFLLEYGFQKEKYQKGEDLEVYYRKDGISVGTCYYYGINNCWEMQYEFNVIIEKDNEEKRLLECHLFNQQNLQQLKNDLINKKMRDQIHFYSLFLKNNISALLSVGGSL